MLGYFDLIFVKCLVKCSPSLFMLMVPSNTPTECLEIELMKKLFRFTNTMQWSKGYMNHTSTTEYNRNASEKNIGHTQQIPTNVS